MAEENIYLIVTFRVTGWVANCPSYADHCGVMWVDEYLVQEREREVSTEKLEIFDKVQYSIKIDELLHDCELNYKALSAVRTDHHNPDYDPYNPNCTKARLKLKTEFHHEELR